MRKILTIILLFISSIALAAAPSRPFTYVASTVIDPNQNNSNENTLYTYLQAGVDTYASGSITSSAISASAGIPYSKLTLSNSILNADVNTAAAIAYSKLNLSNSIVNADIASGAAIVGSKLNLTSPGAIGSTAANTGAFTTLKVGTTHQGDVLYDNGTTFVRLTPGTNGQFLQTQGAAANPQWASVTTPALTLKQTVAVPLGANSGAITLTPGNTYKIVFKLASDTNADNLNVSLNSDSGTNYMLTGTSSPGATTDTVIPSLSTAQSQSGTVDLYPVKQSNNHNYYIYSNTMFTVSGTGNLTNTTKLCQYQGAADVSTITFISSSGNISGTIWVYEYSGT